MRLADTLLQQCIYQKSSQLNLDPSRDFGLTQHECDARLKALRVVLSNANIVTRNALCRDRHGVFGSGTFTENDTPVELAGIVIVDETDSAETGNP